MRATAVEQLTFLLGSFAGSDQVHPSVWAPGGPATSTATASAELDGDVVVQRYTQRRAGLPSFEIVAIWMVDTDTDDVLFYGFDTAGFAPDPPARGTWHGADLVLDRTTARGSSRLVVRPSAPGWAWSKHFRAPDAETWTPVFEAIFTPVPESVAPAT